MPDQSQHAAPGATSQPCAQHAPACCLHCCRAPMATRLRPARLLPSRRHTTNPWRPLLQQVHLPWQSASATHLPYGLMADHNGGVGATTHTHRHSDVTCSSCSPADRQCSRTQPEGSRQPPWWCCLSKQASLHALCAVWCAWVLKLAGTASTLS